MGFNARFLLVFCLLILLGNVLAHDNRSGKREVEESEYDDHSWGQLQDISRNDSANEVIAPRTTAVNEQEPLAVTQFFQRHVRLVEPQRKQVSGQRNWRHFAAIWIVAGHYNSFKYDPRLYKEVNKPIIDNSQSYSPPSTFVRPGKKAGGTTVMVTAQNYVIARPLQNTGASNIHAEQILLDQVQNLKNFATQTTAKEKPVQHVMIFSRLNPCEDCARHLVQILNEIKATNGKQKNLDCFLVYATQWSDGNSPGIMSDNEVNTTILKPGGIQRFKYEYEQVVPNENNN